MSNPDGTVEPPADAPPANHTLMQRVAALEGEMALLVKALRLAFGERWMDELKIREVDGDEPAG